MSKQSLIDAHRRNFQSEAPSKRFERGIDRALKYRTGRGPDAQEARHECERSAVLDLGYPRNAISAPKLALHRSLGVGKAERPDGSDSCPVRFIRSRSSVISSPVRS